MNIEVKTRSGKVAFLIHPDGRLWDVDKGWHVTAPQNCRVQDDWRRWDRVPVGRCCDEPHHKLRLESVTRGLDGSDIATFTVGRGGDYVRWIGKDGVGYWDLWRPAGTRVDKAYVTEVKP